MQTGRREQWWNGIYVLHENWEKGKNLTCLCKVILKCWPDVVQLLNNGQTHWFYSFKYLRRVWHNMSNKEFLNVTRYVKMFKPWPKIYFFCMARFLFWLEFYPSNFGKKIWSTRQDISSFRSFNFFMWANILKSLFCDDSPWMMWDSGLTSCERVLTLSWSIG